VDICSAIYPLSSVNAGELLRGGLSFNTTRIHRRCSAEHRAAPISSSVEIHLTVLQNVTMPPTCFFSLRNFGHLSGNSIKIRRNSIHKPTFSHIMTELT